MIDPNFPALSRVLRESLLFRLCCRTAAVIDAAWPHSWAARTFDAASRLRDTRFVASIAATGVALAAAAQFAIPVYVRPGLPIAWPLMLVALLSAVAVWSSAFERAWPTARLARAFRRG